MIPIKLQHYNWVQWIYWPWDWIAWVNSPIERKVRNHSGDWTIYKPEHEIQLINAWADGIFETNFCVTFSALDTIETEFNYLLSEDEIPEEDMKWLKDVGFFKNWKINFSDRFTWILWETWPNGAYLYKIARAIKDYWLIPESILPINVSSYAEFVDKSNITEEMYEIGREFKKRFTINYEWVLDDDRYPISKEHLKESLKVWPLQCVVRYADWEGVLNPSGYRNHAVLCNWYNDSLDADNINDSYSVEQKLYSREHPRSYLQFYITINKSSNMNKEKFYKENDQKWVRNINTWAFGKVLRGKLYVVDTKDRTVLMLVDEAHRNNGVSITDVEWKLLDKSTFN